MTAAWDVIVVGARCAGATLATLLARRGLRVLVLDAAARGTSYRMSTHYVQPPGMALLDRLGVGARVRAVTPASRRLRFAMDESEVTLNTALERSGYCVRRSTLDPWLQEAAERARAELRFNHRVLDLSRRHGRVNGVVVRTPRGSETLFADLVVGADGVRSTIAALTAAEPYLQARWTRAGFFSYYAAPATWTAGWDATIEHRGHDLRYIFRADGDQLVAVYMGPAAEVRAWGDNRKRALAEKLAQSPTTAAFTVGQQPVVGPIGLLESTFYYRTPVGPGFALVGDAGHYKDFVTGQGMTDAFLDAELLASAILDGRPQAFEHYWRQRDASTLPLHFDALRQGGVDYNTPFMRGVIALMARRPDLQARLARMFERTLDPNDLVPMPELLKLIGGELLRGRLGVLPGFLRTGRERAAEHKERELRARLLVAASDALHAAPLARPVRESSQVAFPGRA